MHVTGGETIPVVSCRGDEMVFPVVERDRCDIYP